MSCCFFFNILWEWKDTNGFKMPLILHCINIKSCKAGLTVNHFILYVQLMVNCFCTFMLVKVSWFFKVLWFVFPTIFIIKYFWQDNSFVFVIWFLVWLMTEIPCQSDTSDDLCLCPILNKVTQIFSSILWKQISQPGSVYRNMEHNNSLKCKLSLTNLKNMSYKGQAHTDYTYFLISPNVPKAVGTFWLK